MVLYMDECFGLNRWFFSLRWRSRAYSVHGWIL